MFPHDIAAWLPTSLPGADLQACLLIPAFSQASASLLVQGSFVVIAALPLQVVVSISCSRSIRLLLG